MTFFRMMTWALIMLLSFRLNAAEVNIFHDPQLQTIYTLQNQRDYQRLIGYLKDNNPNYRRAAAMAFASVQAVAAIQPLATLLTDNDETVRQVAAYALGQIRNDQAEPLLIASYEQQQMTAVKGEILEALGKCGTEKGLQFLTSLTETNPDKENIIMAGQLWGIYRFGVRNLVSPQGLSLAVTGIQAQYPDHIRFAAASILARIRTTILDDQVTLILTALEQEKDVHVAMNLAAALGKTTKPEVKTKLVALLDSDKDSRIKINALRACGAFDYASIKETFLRMAAHKDVNMAIIASEYFVERGQVVDNLRYFETAKTITHWRSRANLLSAALKFTPETDLKNKKIISAWIDAAYKKSANTYEKAWLLSAMAWDCQNMPLLKLYTFSNKLEKKGQKVLSTYGMEALVTMFTLAKRNNKLDDKNLQEFLKIFQQAILSQDTSLITTAAGLLQDPEMDLKKYYPDTTFIQTALKNCQLPADWETIQALQQTLAYFTGIPVQPQSMKNKAIDWELVKSIAPDKRIRIKTSKGDLVIRLLVNSAPASVANFVQLIREGFYKHSVFHRVVPNFVIQDGCPRGDGTGGPAYTIGSEFAPPRYRAGSVGMASAGKDTEGSQWFITLCPTPHLDGLYTHFAILESGFEVIPRIEVGDSVLSFEEI